jgi:RsiW-degrading membrane proteinase PrsW (M82 family)
MSIISAFSNINWLAVLVAWVVHVVISLAWYQPIFFGKAWVRLSGKEMKPAKQWIPVGFVAHLVAVIALAVIVNLANATTAWEGILLGLLVSIGFIGAILAGELVWEKIPFKLFLIRVGDQILTLSLAGVIFALWK